jgi:hypothetical protein
MVSFPPPASFLLEADVDATRWINERLDQRREESPTPVGFIVPSGFEAYARLLHPGRRAVAPSYEQQVPLRWSEIASARGKIMHPEVELHALIDHLTEYDYEYWERISVGGERWRPPCECLEAAEALALTSILRPFTRMLEDAWFMLWSGYGDLGLKRHDIPLGMIHHDPDAPEPPGIPAELLGAKAAYRHYLVFRGSLDALPTWFDWRREAPNYFWPDDRAWIVATEIDGFSTYIGATKECIDQVLASPLLEAMPSELTHRFDGIGDPVNGEPWD